MEEKDLQKIIIALQETVDKKVNGKIIHLDEKLDEYIKQDMEWKKLVQPIIDAYDTANRMGNFVQWVSKVILALGVIIGTIFLIDKK